MEPLGARTEELRAEVVPVLARYPEVAAAYLFGSVARGDARRDSDLDVGLVYLRSAARSHDELAPALAIELGRATGFEAIDVVDLEAQGAIFCHRVLREGLRIYVADRPRATDFASDVIVRALDFRPTYELATRGKAAAMRRWLRTRHDV